MTDVRTTSEAASHGPVWRNWSGLESTTPVRSEAPASSADVVRAVERARSERTTVKMIGSGHSFTSISAPEHTMLTPERLVGEVRVDHATMTATAPAGVQLKHLNVALEQAGVSLHNMGDIAEQTLAGAVSTGTHGSGGVVAGLAPQLAGFEMVSGTGEVLRASETENPDVFRLGRVGLGALGVLTEVTFKVEPTFLLRAEERPIGWDELLATFDELDEAHHHVDVHWFPHTDRALLKANTRLTDEDPEPLSPFRAWLDDDFLSNTAFGVLNAVASRVPSLVPGINAAASRVLSARTYSDVAHKVFVSPRTVRFREMEYALPREVGLEALREARRVMDAHDWRISFPVEIRTAPADDVALSTGYGRDSMHLAFHVHHDVDHTAYFAAVENVMRGYGGRPHWGKLHRLRVDDVKDDYPLLDEFLSLRDRLDPDRVFTNPYLRRVLGE
ncbi:D-arabinono-1,4-lactone oxidase [Nocardioides yefusunii]|uniref:D-arabinono-1,4-lactone oxidase n=1 Tax=Nocardioides yefusunii TaxID=2500546 RepID=A0ABW1QXV9_9ACTN|nr:D-arabinono-1,4-lactone oxidase [Nocardioides yefusunii]